MMGERIWAVGREGHFPNSSLWLRPFMFYAAWRVGRIAFRLVIRWLPTFRVWLLPKENPAER